MTRHGYRGSTNRSTTYRRDHSGYSAVPSPVANDGCLSSRADFIPSWLNHLPNNPPQDIPQQKSPLDSNHLSWHPNGLTTVRIQPNCGTRRYQSPDILIQNSPSQSPLPDQRCHHQYRQSAPDSDHGQNLDDGERHRHPIQLASTTSEASPTKNHVFEKQPRRKTRRDRYDTIKSKIERTEKGQGKKSSARVSKKRRLPSSQEIMANFKSQAIANPGERITLEQNFTKFTPGLFVNGRSSASLGDLAFNDILLNHENVEPYEKRHPSNPEPNQQRKRNPDQDETKIFADALKRLIADYPPPESASRLNSAVVSSVTCTRRSNGDNNERPLPCGSHTSRSPSIRSHLTVVNSSHNSTQDVQGRPTTEQEPTAVMGREDHSPHSQNAVKFPRYEDKGVMVSPWTHQRVRENVSYDATSADHQLRPRRAEFSSSRAEFHMPNDVYEISAPEAHEEVTGGFNSKTTRIEDVIYSRDKIPLMSYFDSISDRYPPHALRPRLGSGLSSFDRLDASKVIDTQYRDAYSVDWPANPITFQPRQEAFQETNTLSQRISPIVDDIPGETPMEYIERMEREILGTGEPSARYIDKALHPAETDIVDSRTQPNKLLRGIEYRDRFPQRDQPHESVDLFPKHYPRLSYPEESPDESEPAFVWKPNYFMWC